MDHLPLLLSDSQVSIFKFWHDGKIQSGLRYQNKLFSQIRCINCNHRDRAYDIACHLSQHNIPVIITLHKEENGYILWGDLLCPSVQNCLEKPEGCLNPFLATSTS